MFTSKSIFLLIAIIVLLAIAWNTDISTVYIFFVIVFVMFVLSFAHLYLNIPDIEFKRDVMDTAYEDDILNVKISMKNKRVISSYFFEIVDTFTGAPPEEQGKSLFVLDIKAKQTRKINYVTNCYKRGLWKIGPVLLVSQDALGFFKSKKTLSVVSEILVYPSLFKIFSFPPLASGSVSWMGVETANISGDSHEFFGIREYQIGDAMSRIHWPSSAKHGKLIVKQFERNAVQEATIIFDLKKGHDIGVGRETTLEYAVKIAGSAAKYLLNEGALVQMIAYGKKNSIMIPFGKGQSHMYKIFEKLAVVQADGDMTLVEALEEASFIAPHRSTVITIMLDNDMRALSSLIQFKVKSIKLIIIVLSTSTFGQGDEGEYLDSEAAKKFDEGLANLEAYVYRISKGDDLEKAFETV